MRLDEIYFGGFNLGLNDSDPLDGKGLFKAENVRYDSSGSVVTCLGKTAYLNTVNNPTGHYNFRLNNTENYFMLVENNQTLKYAGSTTWTNADTTPTLANFTAGSHLNTFATFWGHTSDKNLLVIAGYNAAPYRWNPTFAAGSKLAVLEGSPPAGRLLCEHQDRLIISGIDAYPNRMYWNSPFAVGQPVSVQNWGATDWVDVGGKFTNDRIVQIVSHLRALFILKEKSIWVMTGNSPSNWILNKVFDKGTSSPFAVFTRGKFLIFVDEEGIFITDGNDYKFLGQTEDGKFPIKRTWDTIAKANLGGVVGGIRQEELWLAVPQGGGVNNFFLIFNLVSGAYSTNTMYSPKAINILPIAGEDVLIVGENTQCYKAESGSKANTVNSLIQTKAIYRSPYGKDFFIPYAKLFLNNIESAQDINLKIIGDRGEHTGARQVKILTGQPTLAATVGQETSTTARFYPYPSNPALTRFARDVDTSEYRDYFVDVGFPARDIQAEVSSYGAFGVRAGVIYGKEMREGLEEVVPMIAIPKVTGELVANNGFEAGDFTNWTKYVTGSSTITKDTTIKRTGTASCRIYLNDISDFLEIRSDEIIIIPSSDYVFHIWYRGATVNSTWGLELLVMEATGAWTQLFFKSNIGGNTSSTWTLYPISIEKAGSGGTITLPSDAAKMKIIVGAGSGGGVAGQVVNYDDVSLIGHYLQPY